ncbi:MAG: hypothetical protein LC772_09015 [Chloroflexi bacterium]|nr:hypothetical protein [Chloroflexota bacterium]
MPAKTVPVAATALSAILAAAALAPLPTRAAGAAPIYRRGSVRHVVRRFPLHSGARPLAVLPHSRPAESPAAAARRLDLQLIDRPTPGGLGRIDPNGGLYPTASIADFSMLLERPAGRFGFLHAGADGHFEWNNGRRVRFWGVCISRRSISLPHQEIARVADCLARSGCNLVRFEALDGVDGLLSGSPQDSQHINPMFMDELQFWIACLRARGIYYYLDLLDFRRFLPGDDVPNAEALGIAARPYAIFDSRLVNLQEQFARQLLLAVNPYTHLCPAADPALVMVELVNEHGLFMSITQIDKLAAPYNTELQQLWNRWLLKRYTTREALASHWQAAGTPLGAQEDPTSGTVRLLAMPPSESGWDRGGVRSARVREQVDFLADTQRDYFRTMREFLHHMGVVCPITAAVSSTVGPDVLSVADELDCTAENYYADHPKYAGAEWTGSVYYNNDNQLRSSEPGQVAPQIALLRWNNRPVVVREWDTAWPNQYRAAAIPDMAAYASLQDVDMVLLFTYVTGEPGDRLLDFANQCDPTVWGQFGAAASIFLNRLIQPARYTVDVLYSQYDLEHWGPYLSQLHRLAWSSLVRNVVSGALPPPARGVSVLSGRGGYGAVPPRNCLIFQRLDAVPPGDRVSSVENILRTNNIPLTVSPLSSGEFKFSGMVYGAGETAKVGSEVGFLAQDVSLAHLAPVGVDSVGRNAGGPAARLGATLCHDCRRVCRRSRR